MRRIKVIFFIDRPHITFEMLQVLHRHDVPVIAMEVYANVIYFKLPYISEELFDTIAEEFSHVYGFERIEEIGYGAMEERDLSVRRILDFIPQGILLVDAEGAIHYANRLAREVILRREEKDLEGKLFADFVTGEGVTATGTTAGYAPLHELPVIVGGREYSLSTEPLFTEEKVFCGALIYLSQSQMLYWQDYGISFQQIRGRSEVIQELIEKAKLYAEQDVAVLINGEPGTGKGMMARAVHRESKMRQKPFVGIDLAGTPLGILEHKLFGAGDPDSEAYRPGILTGAEGGTVYLDEISLLPAELQDKLTRALETGSFTPEGATQSVPLRLRIIASNSKNLRQLVKAEEFSETLYRQLNAFSLDIPPLRQRREDIPDLVELFLEQAPDKIEHVTEAAMRKLRRYPWPGNGRTLQRVITRAALEARNGIIDEGDIQFFDDDDLLVQEKVDRYERELLIEGLRHSKSIRDGAKKMGMTHTKLLNRIKRYGITKEEWYSERVNSSVEET